MYVLYFYSYNSLFMYYCIDGFVSDYVRCIDVRFQGLRRKKNLPLNSVAKKEMWFFYFALFFATSIQLFKYKYHHGNTTNTIIICLRVMQSLLSFGVGLALVAAASVALPTTNLTYSFVKYNLIALIRSFF